MKTRLTKMQKIKEKRLSSFDYRSQERPPFFSNLREIVDYTADRYGDKVYFTYRRGNVDQTVSFNQYRDLVCNIGTGLEQKGLMGSTVVLIGETCPEYSASYTAVVTGNGVIVPIDRELPVDSIVDFVNHCEAEAIIYGSSMNGKLLGLSDSMPKVKYYFPIMPVGENSECGEIIPLADLAEAGRISREGGNDRYTGAEMDMEKMSILLFTSGTTGSAKGVMLSQKNLVAAINSSCIATNYDSGSEFIDILPVHHTYEMTCGQFGTLACGCSVYINDSIKSTSRNIKKVKPTDVILVPLYLETMRKKIWAEIDKKGMRKKVETAMKLSEKLQMVGIDARKKMFAQIREALGGNVKSFVCGSAPVDPEILYEFDRFGMTVFEGYGITECAPLVSVNLAGRRRFGSVGIPVYGCDVRIDNPDDNGEGEIVVKGDNVMLGYYKNEEATKEAFTEDGYFRTGDIGYFDEDGFLFISGRKKNLILLSNGKNVFPEELEERLLKNDLIAECVVISRLNERGEQIITAVVYPNPDLTKDMTQEEKTEKVRDAVNEVNRTLATYKHINGIELRDTEFEKTTTRKIKRFLVK